MNARFVIAGFGFLLISVSSGVWAADVASVSRGWKTYSNVHGWSVEYPESWHVTGEGGDNTQGTEFEAYGPRSEFDSGRISGSVLVDMKVSRRLANLNPKEYLVASVGKLGIASGHAITVAGCPGYTVSPVYGIYDPSKPVEAYGKRIAFRHGKETFDIRYSEYDHVKNKPVFEKDWRYKGVFDRMVASFRFTKPAGPKGR